MSKLCLEVKDLSIDVAAGHTWRPLVQHVSFAIARGSVLGLVGESGSGKTLTAMAILGLLPAARFRVSGEITLNGEAVTNLSDKQLTNIRGRKIGMVFQNPLTALNPVLTIGEQLAEVFIAHWGSTRSEAKKHSLAMLTKMRLADPDRLYHQYPHQLSGGMGQRVMLAIALAVKPSLLIADEPTTALDVTLQAQILAEFRRLQREYGTTILLISHDMGVIAELADDVAVVRQGRIVEYKDVYSLFDNPSDNYTRQLLSASWLSGSKRNEDDYDFITA